MQNAIFGLMVLLMIFWTALLGVDLVQAVLADQTLVDAATNDSPVEASRNVFFGLLGDLYGPAGQARAVVWGIPMIVFAMVAAISQR